MKKYLLLALPIFQLHIYLCTSSKEEGRAGIGHGKYQKDRILQGEKGFAQVNNLGKEKGWVKAISCVIF